MRGIFLLPMLVAGAAAAEAGRSLPRGEEHPAVVEKAYLSPAGELHFTSRAGERSALLRKPSGHLLPLREVRGEAACGEWLRSLKSEAPPAHCEFVFVDQYGGGSVLVKSESLAEGGLDVAF